MKPLLCFATLVLLAGCNSSLPSEAKARQIEAEKPAVQRQLETSARAATYERQGLSSKEARALAETEYRATKSR